MTTRIYTNSNLPSELPLLAPQGLQSGVATPQDDPEPPTPPDLPPATSAIRSTAPAALAAAVCLKKTAEGHFAAA